MRRVLLAALLAAGLALAAVACGGDDDDNEASGTTTEAAAQCAKSSLDVVDPGRLTIATDNPAFPPWFVGAKPDTPWDPTTKPTKKGFEAAVAYAVARELGFSDNEVTWRVQQFEQLFRPGPKDYDFDINQVSYKPVRAKAVGFSESYYQVEQAVVSKKGSEVAGAKAVADLKDAKFGVQLGTTSYDAVNETIKPSREPSVYNNSNDVVSALKAGQVDAVVVDYPTALYMSAVQIPGGTIVGRLPRGGQEEHFGLVTAKGSSLIPCLNEALATLRSNGTLKRLEQKWIAGSGPPVLQ